MGRGAAAGGAAAGGAAAGGAAAGVSATGSKLWDLATRVDTVGVDNHPTCSRSAWACVFLRSRRADAALTGPFIRPPASPVAGAALQVLRELGIDCSDRNNVVNERNGKSGSTGECFDETSQRRGLSRGRGLWGSHSLDFFPARGLCLPSADGRQQRLALTFVVPSCLGPPCLPGLPLASFDPGVMNDAALQASLPAADATKFAKEDAVAVFYDEHGSGSWKPCCLLARAKGYNRYQIEWQDTRRRQVVTRLQLLTKAENIDLFAKRVSVAVRARRNAVSFLRYNLYIDNMPLDGNPELTTGQISRIRGSALNMQRLFEMENSLMYEQLMGEVTSEYARCINKIVFDEALKEKDFRNMLEHLELPSRPEKPPAPYLGTVDIPPYSYDSASMQFKDVTYNDLGEVIHAMHNVRAECNKVLDTSMFITDLLKALEVSVIYSISSRPFAIYVSLLSC